MYAVLEDEEEYDDSGKCIFKDYNDFCGNDDSYDCGDYCFGRC